MVDINEDLKQYLARNDKHNENLVSKNASSPISYKLSNWWAKSPNSNQSFESGWLNNESQQQDCLSLNRKQRVLGFMISIMMGILCFTMAGLYVPFILLKARKFALLYTFGSLFTVCSFSFLWGPVNHLKYLCSSARLPFTSVYFGSLFATLYFSLEVKSTILTVLFAFIQVAALIWFIVSYIPGGQTGLKFFTKIFSVTVTKTVQNTLPV